MTGDGVSRNSREAVGNRECRDGVARDLYVVESRGWTPSVTRWLKPDRADVVARAIRPSERTRE